jgi:hypothetical protein
MQRLPYTCKYLPNDVSVPFADSTRPWCFGIMYEIAIANILSKTTGDALW